MASSSPHPVLVHLQPLVATQARRRMAVVVLTALLFSLTFAGADVVMPLWTNGELGFSAGNWAQLRSLRMAGTLVGVILLGAFSDRFGQRLLGMLTMLGSAAILLLYAWGPACAVWIAMPVYGALVSTAYVNMNTLTQQISERRQGVANTIYRTVGTAAAVIAPVGAVSLAHAWGGYRPVFIVLAAILVLAAVSLSRYPGEMALPPASDLRTEIAQLWRSYLTACRERDLMRFIIVSQLWGNAVSAVGIFAAIYFTTKLGFTDQAFGQLASVAGGFALLATAGLGLVLDRTSLRRFFVVAGVVTSVCALVMGLSGQVVPTAVAFVIFGCFSNAQAAPMSMWVSRAAGDATQTAAFTMHKILTGLLVAVCTAIVGALEGRIGMAAVLAGSGVAGLLLTGGFLLLKEPPPMRRLE